MLTVFRISLAAVPLTSLCLQNFHAGSILNILSSSPLDIFLFLLIALTFDVKVPSKTYYNMESEMRTYHEPFTEEYFAIAESTRTNCMKELSSLYALPKLKYSSIVGTFNIYYFYQVILTYIRAPFNTHVQCAPGQLE